MADGQTEIAVGDDQGRVILRFPNAISWCALDPQNAFEIGEAIARAAHKAKFGEDAPTDASYLAQQVRARVTDQLRDKLIARVALLMKNAKESNKTPGYWTMTIVDAMLKEVD